MLKGEKRILKELLNRSEEAFNAIYNEYYKLIFYVIIQIVGDEEVANDLTSDTFITMYNKIEQHDINKSFKYWLITIAKNNARQYLRQKNKENLIVDGEVVDHIKDSSGNIKNLLIECKKVLSALEYDVINYKIIFDMTYVEIGKLCNISKSEAFRIYRRAIDKLRTEL